MTWYADDQPSTMLSLLLPSRGASRALASVNREPFNQCRAKSSSNSASLRRHLRRDFGGDKGCLYRARLRLKAFLVRDDTFGIDFSTLRQPRAAYGNQASLSSAFKLAFLSGRVSRSILFLAPSSSSGTYATENTSCARVDFEVISTMRLPGNKSCPSYIQRYTYAAPPVSFTAVSVYRWCFRFAPRLLFIERGMGILSGLIADLRHFASGIRVFTMPLVLGMPSFRRLNIRLTTTGKARGGRFHARYSAIARVCYALYQTIDRRLAPIAIISIGHEGQSASALLTKVVAASWLLYLAIWMSMLFAEIRFRLSARRLFHVDGILSACRSIYALYYLSFRMLYRHLTPMILAKWAALRHTY